MDMDTSQQPLQDNVNVKQEGTKPVQHKQAEQESFVQKAMHPDAEHGGAADRVCHTSLQNQSWYCVHDSCLWSPQAYRLLC